MLNQNMSNKNPSENEDLMWQMHMQTLTKRKRSMEIAQIIDNVNWKSITRNKVYQFLTGNNEEIHNGGSIILKN